MAKIDLDDLKRQIMLLTANSVAREPNAEKLRALALKKRKAAEGIVSPALSRAGLDIAGLREKVVQNARTFRDEAERLRVLPAKTIAARKTAFQKSVASRRAALEKIGRRGVVGPVSSHIVKLREPIYIGEFIPPVDYPLPKFLQDSSISPFDSRAKIYIATDKGFHTDGWPVLYGPWFSFWYVWTNDSSLESYLNITAPLVYSGTAFLELVPAQFYAVWNNLDFAIISTISVYQAGTAFGTVLNRVVQKTLTTYPVTDASTFIPVDHVTSIVHFPVVYVPPNETIMIRVSAVFPFEFRNGYGEDNGEPGNLLRCDFANDDLDHFVQSPGVTLEVTGPIVADPTH
jgi:hypothetical protein